MQNVSLWMLAAIFMTGCGLSESAVIDDHSDVNQLTQQLISCVEYDDAQIEANLIGLSAGLLRKDTWSDKSFRRARNALAGIPKAYLDWLNKVHERNGFYISQQAIAGGSVGMTGSTDLPEYIHITTTDIAVDYALQHEVGHAINIKLNSISGFNDAMQKNFQSEASNSKLRNYAKSSTAEYFAESFNNYYCSKEANSFVQVQLPNTYNYLRQNLEKPRWETGLASGSLGNDLFLDLGHPAAPGGVVPLFISLPNVYTKAAVCRGDYRSCTSTPRDDILFGAMTASVSDRKFFKSSTGLVPDSSETITILGYNAAGQLAAARAVSFKPH